MPSHSFFSAVRVQHVCRRLTDRRVQVLWAAELGVCPTEAGCTLCDLNSLIGPQQAALDDTDSLVGSSLWSAKVICGSRWLLVDVSMGELVWLGLKLSFCQAFFSTSGHN